MPKRREIAVGCVVRLDGSPVAWSITAVMPRANGTLFYATDGASTDHFWIGKGAVPVVYAKRPKRVVIDSDPREFVSRDSWPRIAAGQRVKLTIRDRLEDAVPRVIVGTVTSVGWDPKTGCVSFGLIPPVDVWTYVEMNAKTALCDEGISLLEASVVGVGMLPPSPTHGPWRSCKSASELKSCLSVGDWFLIERLNGEIVTGQVNAIALFADRSGVESVKLSSSKSETIVGDCGAGLWVSKKLPPAKTLRQKLEARALGAGALQKHPLVVDAAVRAYARSFEQTGVAGEALASAAAKRAALDRETQLVLDLSDEELLRVLIPSPRVS